MCHNITFIHLLGANDNVVHTVDLNNKNSRHIQKTGCQRIQNEIATFTNKAAAESDSR